MAFHGMDARGSNFNEIHGGQYNYVRSDKPGTKQFFVVIVKPNGLAIYLRSQ
jgi:hypothetical protein